MEMILQDLKGSYKKKALALHKSRMQQQAQ